MLAGAMTTTPIETFDPRSGELLATARHRLATGSGPTR
jgi:hypothetical protein